MQMPPNVHVLRHPLVQMRLAQARDRRSDREVFRRCLRDVAAMMAFESLRETPTEPVPADATPESAEETVPAREITIVPILRGGLPMAEGILAWAPEARTGHLGIYRDETSREAVVYYHKLPPDVAATDVFVVDAMVATGNSATAAVTAVKHAGATHIRLLCLVAATDGIRRFCEAHPDVPIHTAAVDTRLDRNGYIVPGLGDAGERLFGTR